MYLKRISLTASIVILLGAFVNEGIVNADDDYEDEYEKYEHEHEDDRYYYEDDDEEEYDYEEEEYDYEEGEYYNDTTNVTTNTNTWNVWTRTTAVQKGELPFQETTLVQLKKENGDGVSLYIMPVDGELFVPSKVVAQILGAEATLYHTSEIVEVTYDNKKLIFRAGTNVAYSNSLKTPIPAPAFYMNDDVYVPISVITNGLGFVAEWQAANNTVICKSLTM